MITNLNFYNFIEISLYKNLCNLSKLFLTPQKALMNLLVSSLPMICIDDTIHMEIKQVYDKSKKLDITRNCPLMNNNFNKCGGQHSLHYIYAPIHIAWSKSDVAELKFVLSHSVSTHTITD